MRYMMFIKHGENLTQPEVPQSLYDAMGEFVGESFMAHLGLKVERDADGVTAHQDNGQNLWFSPTSLPQEERNWDTPGLNHFAFAAESPVIVDAAVEAIRDLGIEPLFGTPCERPEYSDEVETYYSLMFATPDRFLFEVVYSGPR